MSERESPQLDPRRAGEFRAELMERVRAWVRDWSVDDASGDFGAALFNVAAHFSAQVAERLDRAGEKLSLGLLDWLAIRGKAARPARMPVAFKLADTALDPVLATKPVRLQADVGGATVVFETENDVKLVPGTLELLVGVAAAKDEYYLPPGGLTSLAPLEPLPTQWRVKSFAEAGALNLQLDPALGLAPDVLLEIAGREYRVTAVEGDLVTLDPPIDAAGGINANTLVTKATQFDPFGTAVRNQQQHIVYLGDSDLFNIEAAAALEIHGGGANFAAATWEYFGKAEGADEPPRWRELPLAPADAQGSNKVRLLKPKGAIEPTQVGSIQSSRWIRAWRRQVLSAKDVLSTEKLTVVVNPGDDKLACPATGSEAKPGVEAEGFANTAPLAFTSAFYPLGREPKQFDTFYLGCADAFSKVGADVSICFELSDPTAHSYSVLREGVFANRVLASVGGDGALHLLEVDGTTGAISGFLKHEPLQPQSSGGTAIGLDPKPPYRLPMWAVNDDQTVPDILSGGGISFGGGLFGFLGAFFSNPFFVATTAGAAVWVWKEYPSFPVASRWISFNSLPAVAGATQIDGLVYLRDEANVASSALYASFGGQLFKHSAVADRAAEAWSPVPISAAPQSLNPNDPYKLSSIAPVNGMDTRDRWHGSLTDGMVGLFTNSTETLVYFVDKAGKCTEVDDLLPAFPGTRPAAAHIGAHVYVFWQLIDNQAKLQAVQVQASDYTVQVGSDDSPTTAASPTAIAGGLLEIAPGKLVATVLATGTRGSESSMLSWTPFGSGSPYSETPLPAGSGPLGGAPTVVGGFLVAPGTQSDAWSVAWNPALRREFAVTLQSGIVVPTSVTPAIARHDHVAIQTSGNTLEHAEVGALDNTLGTDRFHSLETEFGIGASNSQLVLYRHASGSALNGAATAADKMNLDAADHDTEDDEWLLVDDTGTLKFCQVNQVNSTASPWKVTFKHNPNPNLTVGALKYWRAERLPGRVAPFMQLDPNVEGAWDAAVLDRTKLHFTNRDPSLQGARAFGLTPTSRPTLVVLNAAWNTASLGNGASTCMLDAALGAWSRQLGDDTTNPKLIWEFWSGRSWEVLKIELDATKALKLTGRLQFIVPAALTPTEVSGKINHWIRARLIEGDYGREKVTVVTKPDPSDPTATVQEVVRDSSNFHPPLVVNMRIRYSVSQETLPQYLLTQDSGSLRDQSDANRTAGANVEGFVSLSLLMARLENDGADPATKSGQSILLGFDAGLFGEPINVLLLVEERAHDGFAPLTVEALINDRFERVAVRDTTRALGESGLLSMSFPVKPSPRDLFGRSLTWLRLSPSRRPSTGEWRPVIRGAYLNAVWASATETLTREALGSSDGRPQLTVQVARPPLLQGSLELRVREPLDEEERKSLLEADAASVKSTEPDLPGDWVLWKQVPDPDDCGPRERVYALDEGAGEIHFGDGVHGMIPPIGRDSVVAFSYQRTEPAADGVDDVPANRVTERTALQLITPVESVEGAFAADRAAGGSPPEGRTRVLRFGNARLRHRERAIVPQDFADLALQSSPDIAQARAFKRADGLRLVVVMRGPRPAPDASQRRELKRLLQSVATPLLSHPDAIVIEGPRVRRLRVDLELRVATLDDAGRLGAAAKESLLRFFDSSLGGIDESGWPLGAAPAPDDIAFALGEAPGLAGIENIELLEIDADGLRHPWRAQVRSDELVMLAADAMRIQYESLEAQA